MKKEKPQETIKRLERQNEAAWEMVDDYVDSWAEAEQRAKQQLRFIKDTIKYIPAETIMEWYELAEKEKYDCTNDYIDELECDECDEEVEEDEE